MSVRRLTDADKRQIVDLYRTPGETAATLADQFGVSNTTIGRILKAGIDVKEYDQLVQQKRRGNDSAASISTESLDAEAIDEPIDEAIDEPVEASPLTPVRPIATPIVAPSPPSVVISRSRDSASSSGPSSAASDEQRRSRRRRSSAATPTATPSVVFQPDVEPDRMDEEFEDLAESFTEFRTESRTESFAEKPKKVIQVGIRSVDDSAKRSNDRPVRRFESSFEQEDEDEDEDLLPPVTEEIAAIMEEDFGDGEEESDELEDEEDLEEDDDLEEDEISDDDDLLSIQTAQLLRVRPFEEADMPRTCYLVIDRAAELVVRPLGDFGDLGNLPEAKTMTLPIFDNHRVAKRFATDRTQRVIKVPDSQIFYKTAYQLRSKGITHLFVDGQLYSL